MQQSKLEGKFLYLNLGIAIFMDLIVPIPTLLFYLGLVSAPAGFGIGFVATFFGTVFTFLFRYLHTTIEVESYGNEKRAQIRALRQQANAWDRMVSGLARKGEEVEVFFQQQLDEVMGFLAKAIIRKIVKIVVVEFIPVLSKFYPGYLIAAIYDLRELRKERQNFEPVEAEIAKLKEQVDNGAQIAQKAKQEANEEERKNRARKLAEGAYQNKKNQGGQSSGQQASSKQTSSGGGAKQTRSRRALRV